MRSFQVVTMIRQSRDRPSGELELLILPLKKCSLSLNNDTDSEGAYDNDLLGLHEKGTLKQSLVAMRDELTSGQLIEQYEVGVHRSKRTGACERACTFLGSTTAKGEFHVRDCC